MFSKAPDHRAKAAESNKGIWKHHFFIYSPANEDDDD
jgi:hypothetical protein